jgi:hypothetical protein
MNIALNTTTASLTLTQKMCLTPISHESCVNPTPHQFKIVPPGSHNLFEKHKLTSYFYQQTQTYDLATDQLVTKN